jgi:hypothetical protein
MFLNITKSSIRLGTNSIIENKSKLVNLGDARTANMPNPSLLQLPTDTAIY